MTPAEPNPTREHGVDCAWCGALFTNVVELLVHVEEHLDDGFDLAA